MFPTVSAATDPTTPGLEPTLPSAGGLGDTVTTLVGDVSTLDQGYNDLKAILGSGGGSTRPLPRAGMGAVAPTTSGTGIPVSLLLLGLGALALFLFFRRRG